MASKSSNKVCQECGLETLIEDEGKTVCAECGTMVEESKLVSGETGCFNLVETEQLMSRKYKYSSESKVLHEGRMKTAELCDKMKYDASMKEAATKKFVLLYHNPAFMKIPKQYKAALTAVCVFIEGRLNNYPILINDVLSCINKEYRKKFGFVFHRAKQILDLECTYLSYANSIMVILRKSDYPEDLFKQVIDTCKLMDNFWKQRSFTLLSKTYPCAYVVWLASKHCVNKNTKYKKFCEKHSLTVNRTGEELSAKVITFLISVASHIPWVDKKLTRKTVLLYLPDILKYQHTLISKTPEETLPGLPKPLKRKAECSLEESEAKDIKIRKENPSLHDTELQEYEFQDEMKDFLKTESEIKMLASLQNQNDDSDCEQ